MPCAPSRPRPALASRRRDARRRRRPRPRRRRATPPRSASTWRRRSRSARSAAASSSLGLGGLDLGELEVEQVELALARAGALAQLGERRLRLARRGVRGGDLRAARELRVAAEAVEDVELGAGERELAVLVLAVERDAAARRARAGRSTVAERPLTSARVRPSAPIRRASTTSSASAGSRSPSSPRSALGQLEDALDVGLGRARPDDARLRAPAEQQVERVGEHGLARAGLAREHVEAAARAAARPAR